MKKDEKTGCYIHEINGKKYAYVQKGHVWNKEKKMGETSLEYVGKFDDEGNFIPKKRRLVKADIKEDAAIAVLSQSRVGMTRMLWKLSNDIGLVDVLHDSFPKTWKAILSVAFYYVSSGRNAAYMFPLWKEDRETPIGSQELTDADISSLFSGMDEGRRKEFLLGWRNQSSSGRACFFDITSISSYSKENEMVEFGYNRDNEDLPQINLGLIVDSGTRLPIHYSVHDGSIHDVSTLKQVETSWMLPSCTL